MLDISIVKVIYEDNHLIAVNKHAGMLVHGDATGDTPLVDYVKQYIKIRYKKPGDVFLGVIHRLDRPVSGTIIFARTSKGLSRMSELFKKREVNKHYWAVTKNRPDPISGHLKHFLLKDHNRNVTKAYDKIGKRTAKAKLATLDYELVAGIDAHYLIEARPITGRPHQIRVQLSELGCPIFGDIKYGFKNKNDDGSIHLHCRKMTFMHPIKKKPVSISCDPPYNFFWNLFNEYF